MANDSWPESMMPSRLLVILGVAGLLLGWVSPAWSQTFELEELSAPPQVLQLLEIPLGLPSSTTTTPAQSGLTVPSLWWAEAQFGQGIVNGWQSYDATASYPKLVRLTVDSQLWRQLTVLNRYALVNHFAVVTRDTGYQLLVFDPQNNPVAAYTCNFDQVRPKYLEGVRDAQGRLVPDYVPALSPTPLDCQAWLSPVYPVVGF